MRYPLQRICLSIVLFASILPTNAQISRNLPLEDSLTTVLKGELSREDRASTLLSFGSYWRYIDSTKALVMLREVDEIAGELGDIKMKADANYRMSDALRQRPTIDQSMAYLKKALKGYEQVQDTLFQAFILGTAGRGYGIYYRTKRDTAIYLLEKALDVFNSGVGSVFQIAWCYEQLAVISRHDNNYFKSLNYYNQSIEVWKAEGDTNRMAQVLSQMGEVYMDMNAFDQCIHFSDSSIRLLKAIDPTVVTNLWLKENNRNIGMSLISRRNYDEAGPYLFVADSLVPISRGTHNAILFAALGDYFFYTYQLDSALVRYNEAVFNARENEDMEALPVALLARAKLFQKVGNIVSAEKDAKESLDLAIETFQPKYQRDAAEVLASLNAEKRDYRLAYNYYKDYHELSDSLLNADKIRSITTLENQYAFEEEKKELVQQQREKELVLQAEIQRKEFVQYGLFAGLGGVALIALLFYRFYHSKKRDNEKISEQAEELQKKNEEMTELSNYKQGLTQMIAHDMKNPLNVIIAIADKPEGKESWAEVTQSGKLMLQMVNNMLDIQRFEETKMNLKLENISLADLANQSKYQVELLMMAKSIQFKNEVDPSIVVDADADIVSRIFVNLFTNAIKYMPIGGSIRVTARSENERVFVSVTDTGKGISPEVQKHIFDKFWQSDPKKFGMSTSNGLGLTFCKLAVSAHEGEISVESEEGNGATFTFDLSIGDENLAVSELQKEYESAESNMTDEEIALIRKLSQELKRVPIYRSTRIEEILKSIESEQSPGIVLWRQKLREAFYSYDNEAFEELTAYE